MLFILEYLLGSTNPLLVGAFFFGDIDPNVPEIVEVVSEYCFFRDYYFFALSSPSSLILLFFSSCFSSFFLSYG